MDPNGQVYFDELARIPKEDRERLLNAERMERLQAEAKRYEQALKELAKDD